MNEVTRITPAQGFGETLMKLLQDPNVPADKLQIMLQMQRELLAEQRREAFQTAFVQMAQEMPQVRKDGTVELTKEGKRLGSYKYLRWEDMDTVMRPILNKWGFALTFAQIASGDGRVIVRGELMHASGHSITSDRTMPPDKGPGRNELQAIGSAISYAKRYLAEGLCNIVRRGEDDDGIKAYERKIDETQAAELSRLLDQTHTPADTFLQIMVTGVDQIENVAQRDYPRLVNALNEKQRKQKEKK